MSHMKFYYTYAILSMYTSHEEKSRTQFNIDILSFWHYFIWNSVRVNTISQDIIKRLLHDIFHIGPGISQRLPYQARQRSWGVIWVKGWYQGRYEKFHVIIFLSHILHWPFPSIDIDIAKKIFELKNCENKSLRELPLFNLQIFMFQIWFQKYTKQCRQKQK